MKHNTIYCCEEHLDDAFDDFLVINETFPVVNAASFKKCSYCDSPASYELDLQQFT